MALRKAVRVLLEPVGTADESVMAVCDLSPGTLCTWVGVAKALRNQEATAGWNRCSGLATCVLPIGEYGSLSRVRKHEDPRSQGGGLQAFDGHHMAGPLEFQRPVAELLVAENFLIVADTGIDHR